jgi:hypothetical protein
MHYLVIDDRFRSPVHVFLEHAPGSEAGFPGLCVRSVALDVAAVGAGGYRLGAGGSVGQDPGRPGHFREFGSDGAVAAAGFGLIEPRFIGGTWAEYDRAFRFGGKTVSR